MLVIDDGYDSPALAAEARASFLEGAPERVKVEWRDRWGDDVEEKLKLRRALVVREVEDVAAVLLHDGLGLVVCTCARLEGRWYCDAEAAAGNIWIARGSGQGIGIAPVEAPPGVLRARATSGGRTYEVELNEEGLGLIVDPDVASADWWPLPSELLVGGRWTPHHDVG